MKEKVGTYYELNKKEFELIKLCLSNIRKYHESNGAENLSLLTDSLLTIELIFDDIE